VFFIYNKSAIILLLKTVDSLGIFILLFLSILYINTGYEDEEYQESRPLDDLDGSI
jgi:hypothetical protein